MAKNFTSFDPILRRYISKVQPKTILEWGPGHSTNIMLDMAPDAKIVSIEHNQDWYIKAAERFAGYHNLEINHINAVKRKSRYAFAGFRAAPYDLIFIDGRRRVECAVVALQCIKPSGVIILHDADRKEYLQPLEPLIDVIDSMDDTIAFRPQHRAVKRQECTADV